jgi:hypothetical protein
MLLFGGRDDRPDLHDLLFGRVGESADDQAGDAEDDQKNAGDGERFHGCASSLSVATPPCAAPGML